MSQRKGQVRRFLNSRSGATAVVFAAMAPVMCGVVGLAVDYGVYSMKRSELQNLADAASVAGAKELTLVNADDKSIESVAENFVMAALKSDHPDYTFDVAIDRKSGKVKTMINEQWSPAFAHFLDAAVTPIEVTATASLAGSTSICILTLDETNPAALRLEFTARLQAANCGTYSNSVHKQGLWFGLASRVNAGLNCSAGGAVALSKSIVPKPLTDCPKIPDPLASRVEPKVGLCDFDKFEVSTGTVHLHPGTYCGGLKITGDAKVIFDAGDYIISDGEFKIDNKATVTGEYVSFFLAGDTTVLNFTGDSSVSLTGSKEGEMAGLLFFEQRSAPLARQHRLGSLHADVLTGTIYLPRGKLIVDPNGPIASKSAYTAIVSHQLLLTLGPELVMNSDYASTDVPVPDGIRYASSQVLLTD